MDFNISDLTNTNYTSDTPLPDLIGGEALVR